VKLQSLITRRVNILSPIVEITNVIKILSLITLSVRILSE
jgi:hypothetical protein